MFRTIFDTFNKNGRYSISHNSLLLSGTLVLLSAALLGLAIHWLHDGSIRTSWINLLWLHLVWIRSSTIGLLVVELVVHGLLSELLWLLNGHSLVLWRSIWWLELVHRVDVDLDDGVWWLMTACSSRVATIADEASKWRLWVLVASSSLSNNGCTLRLWEGHWVHQVTIITESLNNWAT